MNSEFSAMPPGDGGQERRRDPRYCYSHKPSTVSAKVLWASRGYIESSKLRILDISRSGFGLACDEKFAVGDTLQLQLTVGEQMPVKFTAIICNCREVDTEYRYGAYFEYDAEPGDSRARTLLGEVEQHLRENSLSE